MTSNSSYVIEFKPEAFPICSECDSPYVLRRALVAVAGDSPSRYEWVWQRDCKHRQAKAQLFEPMQP